MKDAVQPRLHLSSFIPYRSAMHVIGLDIGGANLKAADNDGNAISRPFALWREPQRLREEIVSILAKMSPRRTDCQSVREDKRHPVDGIAIRPTERVSRLAVTMTAELCDCFATKAEGIDFILNAVETVADGTEILVWQTGGEFVPPDVARDIPQLVAAANWHALATFCGRMVPQGAALLIDVGSTTTDVIPLLDGRPVATGMTDRERLKSGELVYTGVKRTPVCAVTREVTLGGALSPFAPRTDALSRSERRQCSLAAELFATMLDVYLLLGDIPEAPDDCDTANGKPATRAAAIDRLARMLCCDRTELPEADVVSIARQLAEIQRSTVASAVQRVLRTLPESCRTVVTSGSGEFLARRVVEQVPELAAAARISLPQVLGPEIAAAACAYAVARLAAEQ
jgi:(4-(4-[2-(gamma-L-glutamylamino)ethyl]phenoxymethyl)furan-2-yl)methanamine synthase